MDDENMGWKPPPPTAEQLKRDEIIRKLAAGRGPWNFIKTLYYWFKTRRELRKAAFKAMGFTREL